MSKKPNLATLILFAALPQFAGVAHAQSTPPAAPVSSIATQFVGGDTRIGIGLDNYHHLRGDVSHVFRATDNAATIGEVWAAKQNGYGLKLSHGWVSNDWQRAPGSAVVHKVFVAADQDIGKHQKITLGYGQERESFFWSAYLGHGLSGTKEVAVATTVNTVTQTGNDGRPFQQDLTTTTVVRSYARAYDWSLGLRAGHFYPASSVRVTGGFDHDWGRDSARQNTASVTLDKYFENSPFSLSLTGAHSRRSGPFETERKSNFAMAMLRYEFGGRGWRPSATTRQVSETVMKTETRTVQVPVPAAPPVAPVVVQAPPPAPAAVVAAPAPAAPQFRIEKKVNKSSKNAASESYFTIGQAALSSKAKEELGLWAKQVQSMTGPGCKVRFNVVGHTCPTGSDRNNFPLAQRRADAVKGFLAATGASTITTESKAGKAPKYPEVKGQSWRNRRADAEAIIDCETTEDVRVEIPAPPRPPAPPAVQAPPPPPPALARAAAPAQPAFTTRTETVQVPTTVTREERTPVSNWVPRALRSVIPHNTVVGTYATQTTSVAQALGAKVYINRCPAAVNDSYSVPFNSSGNSFNVLANDTDADGDTLSIASVTQPGKGAVTLNSGRLLYTPNTGYSGSDSFTYTITDGKCATQTATVTVTVQAAPPPPPVAGVCGTSTGQTFATAPASNLCATGASTSVVTGASGYSWSCQGTNGGTNASCSAFAPAPVPNVTATCGSANGSSVVLAPTTNLCLTGTPTSVVTGSRHDWSCRGSGTGASVNCSATIPPPNVTGSCGTANGSNFAVAPTANLCNSGVATSIVTTSNRYDWSCQGSGTGATANCTAYPGSVNPPANITGVCGTANGSNFPVAPTTNLCSAGVASSIVTTSSRYDWSCGGSGSGTTTNCTAFPGNATNPNPPTGGPALCKDDIIYVPCEGTSTLDVLANDTGSSLRVSGFTQTPIGTVSLGSDGKLRWAGGDRCYVTQRFTYTVTSGATSSTCTVVLIDP